MRQNPYDLGWKAASAIIGRICQVVLSFNILMVGVGAATDVLKPGAKEEALIMLGLLFVSVTSIPASVLVLLRVIWFPGWCVAWFTAGLMTFVASCCRLVEMVRDGFFSF